MTPRATPHRDGNRTALFLAAVGAILLAACESEDSGASGPAAAVPPAVPEGDRSGARPVVIEVLARVADDVPAAGIVHREAAGRGAIRRVPGVGLRVRDGAGDVERTAVVVLVEVGVESAAHPGTWRRATLSRGLEAFPFRAPPAELRLDSDSIGDGLDRIVPVPAGLAWSLTPDGDLEVRYGETVGVVAPGRELTLPEARASVRIRIRGPAPIARGDPDPDRILDEIDHDLGECEFTSAITIRFHGPQPVLREE